jgi:methyltransferase
VTAFHLIIGLVILQRLAELVLAARNTKALLAQGAIEIGARHYPLFILLHSSWLLAIVLTTDPATPPQLAWLGIFIVLELGRFWVLSALGGFFTTRIISLPNAPLVRHGPYRFCNHPNYCIVVGEIAVLPMMFGNVGVAVVWSILNLCLLTHRIRLERTALEPRRTADRLIRDR